MTRNYCGKNSKLYLNYFITTLKYSNTFQKFFTSKKYIVFHKMSQIFIEARRQYAAVIEFEIWR